ncbi:hypothetical protein HDU98_005428 [Podochytrium sp. JEL0797]|nr:hypothetical protein HDU98_005428 [Podochytrium sp. JEL0797]
MRQLVASGDGRQAVALFGQLRAADGAAFGVLLAALEAAGDAAGARRVAKRVASSAPSSPASRHSPALQLALHRALLDPLRPQSLVQAMDALDDVAEHYDSHDEADSVEGQRFTLRLAVVEQLLGVGTTESAFLALGVLQRLSTHDDALLSDARVAPLVASTFGHLGSLPELRSFVASNAPQPRVFAAAASAVVATGSPPSEAVDYLRQMIYALRSLDAVPASPRDKQVATKAVVDASRKVLAALENHADIETASGLAAEAFQVFKSSDKQIDSLMARQAFQEAYFAVLAATLKSPTDSVLKRNGTTIQDLVDLCSLYIENFCTPKPDDILPTQRTFHLLLQLYLLCIPLARTLPATHSTSVTYTLEGAVNLWEDLKSKGFTPTLTDYHALFSRLAQPSATLPRAARIRHLQSLFESLERSGISPTQRTYAILFSACNSPAAVIPTTTVTTTGRHVAHAAATPPDVWFKHLQSHMKHVHALPHTYGSASALLQAQLASGNYDACVRLWNEMRVGGLQRDYTGLFETAAGVAGAGVGQKRFAAFCVSDVMFEMDRERVRKKAGDWFALVKCCVVARSLVGARAVVEAMKEERGGVVVGEDARVYGAFVRLVFLEDGWARLFGRELVLEVRGLGVFAGRMKWEGVMEAVVGFYLGAGKGLVDAEVVDAVVGVTDFSVKGEEEGKCAERKEEVKRRLGELVVDKEREGRHADE